MHQVFGHVKANAARTNQRHRLPHGAFVADHIQVAHHLGVVNAFDLGLAWGDARGQHHLGEAGLGERLGAHFVAQLELDAGQFNLLAKVAQRFIKLFLARNLLCDVELAANFGGGVKQCHVKTATRRRGGKCQASRPCAHHSHALFDQRRRLHHQRLVASPRVDQARSNLAAKGVVQAGLVAANAGVDLVSLARSGLVHKLRVGQKGPRHGNHIGHAVGQYLLGHLGGVDAVGGDQRNAYLALELLRNPGKSSARHLGGDGGYARLVPADAGVQNGDACSLQGLGELHHFFQCRATLDQIEHGQAEDHDEIGTHLGPGAAHDF